MKGYGKINPLNEQYGTAKGTQSKSKNALGACHRVSFSSKI